MQNRIVTAIAAFGFAVAAALAATPAAASPMSAVSPGAARHCVGNLDTHKIACADTVLAARVATGDAALQALTIAVFYDGTGYTGATFTWVLSTACTPSYDDEAWVVDLSTEGWNNRLSSVHTYNQCDVKLFDGTNFSGAASTWIDQSSDLGAVGTGWSNRASSVKFS